MRPNRGAAIVAEMNSCEGISDGVTYTVGAMDLAVIGNDGNLVPDEFEEDPGLWVKLERLIGQQAGFLVINRPRLGNQVKGKIKLFAEQNRLGSCNLPGGDGDPEDFILVNLEKDTDRIFPFSQDHQDDEGAFLTLDPSRMPDHIVYSIEARGRLSADIRAELNVQPNGETMVFEDTVMVSVVPKVVSIPSLSLSSKHRRVNRQASRYPIPVPRAKGRTTGYQAWPI